jgi:hypothetical protein
MEFEVLIALVINVDIFLDIAACSPYVNWCFREANYVHIQGRNQRCVKPPRSRWPSWPTLNSEVICSSETSVHIRTTWCYIPEYDDSQDSFVYNQRTSVSYWMVTQSQLLHALPWTLPYQTRSILRDKNSNSKKVPLENIFLAWVIVWPRNLIMVNVRRVEKWHIIQHVLSYSSASIESNMLQLKSFVSHVVWDNYFGYRFLVTFNVKRTVFGL